MEWKAIEKAIILNQCFHPMYSMNTNWALHIKIYKWSIKHRHSVTHTDSRIRYTQNINNYYIENTRKQQYWKVMSSSQNSDAQLYPILTLLIFIKIRIQRYKQFFLLKRKLKLYSVSHFSCIASFLLVLLANTVCTAEQLYFVFQQSWEKKSKCSPSVLWFPHDVMACRLTVNNFQSNMLSQSLLF